MIVIGDRILLTPIEKNVSGIILKNRSNNGIIEAISEQAKMYPVTLSIGDEVTFSDYLAELEDGKLVVNCDSILINWSK